MGATSPTHLPSLLQPLAWPSWQTEYKEFTNKRVLIWMDVKKNLYFHNTTLFIFDVCGIYQLLFKLKYS